ncbi:MAG: class II glutamine amidotransferase [Clostridiales Family XIII bacterium]|jgi:glutamine amidotransferase|nr:class II glutamine amidotransferase [Clostridiales Family XIII bacterium]
MCQLFAVNADRKININEELSTFVSHSVLHKHGWGYADFSEHRVHMMRETNPAFSSTYLKEKLSKPFDVKNGLFHLRYATIGAVDIGNTHPLTALDLEGRQWSIIHNGTIFNGDNLDRFFNVQTGDTDTERLLLYIIERMNSGIKNDREPLNEMRRFKILNKALTEIAPGNKLNVILSDSEVLYVHANSLHGSRLLGEEAWNDYLYLLDLGSALLFCTVPLDDRSWTPIPLNTVLAYKDGKLLYEGKPHDYIYLESEADINGLYREFSLL